MTTEEPTPASQEAGNRPPLVEVCIASLEDARVAESAGAARLELNTALELGGLTPSLGLVRSVLSDADIPVIVMVRPRPGGFHYSRAEQQLMLKEIELFRQESIAGIAIGALEESGRIDTAFLSKVRQAIGDLELVLHRAVDTVTNLEQAVETAFQIGVTRILTSGGAAVAFEGISNLARMHSVAAGRVEILPASGINETNAVQILRETGCSQVHGSFSTAGVDEAGGIVDGGYRKTDAGRVAAVVRAVSEKAL